MERIALSRTIRLFDKPHDRAAVMTPVAILLTLLAMLTAGYLVVLALKLRENPRWPAPEAIALSAVANFFDALGIGSFATSTAYMKFRRLIPDHMIPATMMVGYATATVAEAFIYITSIEVDPGLLCACIIASSIGALAGVSVAPRLPVQTIRTTMGIGLLIAAVMYAVSNAGLMPAGGTATALATGPFIVVVIVSFLLGVLINLGIGNFAPTLITVSLLGMDPRAAFPIMMGSGAFLMISSGTKILRSRPVDLSVVGGMILGGAPAVAVAAYLVKSLPLAALRWGVVVVVTYAGIVMLGAALRSRRDGEDAIDPATSAAREPGQPAVVP